mgnify:CR=1 FL=1
MMPYVYGYIGAAVGTATCGLAAVCVTTTRIRNRADEARLTAPLAPERDDLSEPMPRIPASHYSDEAADLKDGNYVGAHRKPLTIGDRAEIAGDRLRGLALRRQARDEATVADERGAA